MAKNIVSEKKGIPVLENQLGCKLVPDKQGDFFGLGTFYLDGKKLGGTVTCFAMEETAGRVFRATEYEIVENGPEKGVVRFFGKDGRLDISVTITLLADSPGFKIDYAFDPIHPLYHPLYVNVPFDSSEAVFVKFPYEDTLGSEFKGRWPVEPDRGRVPFLFGCQNAGDGTAYVGVGYPLTESFTEGRFEYDPQTHPDAPFKIYTPFNGIARPVNLQCTTRLERLHVDLAEDYRRVWKTFSVIVSVAKSQYDCVKGYVDHSDYDPTVPYRGSIEDAVEALMTLYRDAPAYIEGTGYPQLVRFDTGNYSTTIPHGWYSKYIATGPQVQLAHELYRRWKTRPEETWARDRAVEMADFAVEMQADNGAFTTWDSDTGKMSVLHPDDTEGTNFLAHIYSTLDTSVGALHLYMLYKDAKEFEGVERPEWKEAALKGAGYIASLVGPDGELGRNYSVDGRYDKLTSGLSYPLTILDYMADETQDARFAEARDKVEGWLYERFIKVNDWCNASVDGGAWQGTDWPPPHNNDAFYVISLATYYTHRHMKTGESKYLQMAKDAVAYHWLIGVPVQYPGYEHTTKGLQKEQGFYSAFDVPFRTDEIIDCLPYLSKVTDDPFFMRYYHMLIQTQLDYQALDMRYPGFYIGLESDDTGREPIDKLAEGGVGYILRFAPVFLKSVLSPNAYRYVGGSGWGVGLDYFLPFDPNLGPDAPYVLSASTMVRDMAWDSEASVLYIDLYSRGGKKEEMVEIKWQPDAHPIEKACIDMDGEVIEASDLYDSDTRVLSIKYVQEKPTRTFKIRCRGMG